ncbi:hypothetical protein [Bacillus thuringiensis]|uniref:hypothetical protein n=1 Tax=Bacillus thuringiensis TaxID=1428 RepID=UPI000BFD7E7A|nr:hypothetical protein [Bacillus thuringiensis]PGT89856.1 hypothetical protein COD17_08895 [Bacillus thuringiensis]
MNKSVENQLEVSGRLLPAPAPTKRITILEPPFNMADVEEVIRNNQVPIEPVIIGYDYPRRIGDSADSKDSEGFKKACKHLIELARKSESQ